MTSEERREQTKITTSVRTSLQSRNGNFANSLNPLIMIKFLSLPDGLTPVDMMVTEMIPTQFST